MANYRFTTQCGLQITVDRKIAQRDEPPTIEEISLELGAEHANKTFRRVFCDSGDFHLKGAGWGDMGYTNTPDEGK